MVRFEARRRGYSHSRIAPGCREDGQLFRGARLERRKAAIILQIDGCVLCWRCAGAVDMKPADKVRGIVRKDASTASKAVARDPVPEFMLVLEQASGILPLTYLQM